MGEWTGCCRLLLGGVPFTSEISVVVLSMLSFLLGIVALLGELGRLNLLLLRMPSGSCDSYREGGKERERERERGNEYPAYITLLWCNQSWTCN